MLAVVSQRGNHPALDAIIGGLYPTNPYSWDALDSYLERLNAPVGSPERLALVADLRAALPGVLDALGVTRWTLALPRSGAM